MISNPYLFRCAPMVTTFVCLASNRTLAIYGGSLSGGHEAGGNGAPLAEKNFNTLCEQGPDLRLPELL